ncbi:sensor histidine kinase [Nocardioides sp.]|uniref:sensor histidine kinase n=1 Tax=Nocardioides sp. TaxID=35761 RepID=UPI002ED5F2E9
MVRGTVARPRVSALVELARPHATAALLVVMVVLSWLLLRGAEGASGVPLAWPAAGLLPGVLLLNHASRRASLLALGGALLLLCHLLADYVVMRSVGFTVASVAGTWLMMFRLNRLSRGARGRPRLAEEGDVSTLIGGATLSAGVAAVTIATTVAVTGDGSPWLALGAAFGTHATAMLMLLPLFLSGPRFASIAPPRERVLQSVVTLGVTLALFSYADAPPLVFAIMPMFAWLAFRGTLREASLLLTGVGAIATAMTLAGRGPVHGLLVHYDLAQEMVNAYLQLFLLDCALILLPLVVITTQQRTASAQASSRQRTLERLVDAATGTAVFAIGRNGRIELFNPGAERVFARTSAEMVGEPVDRVFSDLELVRHGTRLGARPVFADICSAAAAAEEERQLWSFNRPDGEERAMLLSLTSVLDELGDISGYLCVAEDVTEREAMHRAALQALEHERSAVERLRELERVKADFVATVSHELRTPLTSMIGYVELLEEGAVGELSSDQRQLANRVQRNGRRLLLLVEDLLLLSEIESRQMSMSPVQGDLRDAAGAALDGLGPLLATRHLDVVVRLPDGPVVHEADPDQVERLVLNLLGNAVKFTPDGGRIELVVTDRPETVEIVVLDTGMGIPADEQDQLFTRFFRSSTAMAQAIQGTGLGLTIVQSIVALHGGHISVSSNEGVGTTVSVSLPKQLPAVSPAHHSATP